MTDDDLLRLALLACFISLLPFGIYHRFRSHTGEKLDRWQEGPVLLFALRLSGLSWFLGILAWMIHPPWMAWSAVPFPLWLRWGGFVFIALGAGLLVWTFQNLGKNLTDTVVTRKNHTLVTTGPYRHVRHPFYVAGFLSGVGLGVVTANGFLLLAGLVPLGLLVVRTRIEEAKLIERFGDEYRAYMAKTGRFFPRLWS